MKNENEYGARLTVLAHDMVDQLGTDAPEWATQVAAAAGHPGVWGDLDVEAYDRGQLAAAVWDDRVPRELHEQALRRLVADGFDGVFGADDLAAYLDRFGRVHTDLLDLYLLLDEETRVEHASRSAEYLVDGRDNVELRLVDGVTLTPAHVARFVERGCAWATCAKVGLVPAGGFASMLTAPKDERAYRSADRTLVGIAALLAGETLDLKAARTAFGKLGSRGDIRVADGEERPSDGQGLKSLLVRWHDARPTTAFTADAHRVLTDSDAMVPRTIAAALGLLDAAGLHQLATETFVPSKFMTKADIRQATLSERAVVALTSNALDPADAVALFMQYRFPGSRALTTTTVPRDDLKDAALRSVVDMFLWIGGAWTANPYDRELLAEMVATDEWRVAVSHCVPNSVKYLPTGTSLAPWGDLLDLDTSAEVLRLVAAVPGAAAVVAARLADVTADEAAEALDMAR